MSARWNSADIGKNNAPTPSVASPKGKTPPKAREAATDDETPPIPLAKETCIGPYHLTVANGTHFPGRMRACLVGPADEDLIRAVLGAMQSYYDAKAANL